MDSQVGSILRAARNRRKIDLSEVEAATRIRARFLRAIENEEWDVLPGGVYTRGFIRTYAAFLGLDGERLADDYRASVEGAPGVRGQGSEPARTAAPRPTPRTLPGAGLLALIAVVLIAVIAIAVIPGGNGSGVERTSRARTTTSTRKKEEPKQPSPRAGVAVQLAASAEVWVCVLDAQGQPLVDGQILEAGAEEGPFHSGSFTVSFGNGEVSMLIDGKEAEIPTTSSPVGYSINAAGALTELGEAERPTCT